MEIGKQIRRRRTELNLSRGELANKIHVTPSAIANYENGVSYPKVELLSKTRYFGRTHERTGY